MKEVGRTNIVAFGLYFLPKLFPGPVADVHRELGQALLTPEDLLAFLPRGSAKSTWVSTVFPIWNQCYDKNEFPVLLSHTDEQVVALFADMLEPVLNDNDEYVRLHETFGDKLAIYRDRNGRLKVNDHAVKFANGNWIVAKSAGASARGLKRDGKRPTVLIVDDLENDKTVISPAVREFTWSWFTRAAQPMLNPERRRTIIIGTLLHDDALMPRAERSGAYRVIKKKSLITEPTNTKLWNEWNRIWNAAAVAGRNGREESRAFYEQNKAAMDKGAEVLWPSRFPLIYLMEERRRLGAFAFATEYQNEPAPSENQIVRADQINDFTMKTEIIHGQPEIFLCGANGVTVKLSECLVYGAVDPAISQKNTADYFALGWMAAHPNGTRWFLEFVRDRMPFHQQIEAIITGYVSWRRKAGDRVVSLGVESVMYQQALKDELDRVARSRGLSIPTMELRPITDKVLRLTRHQPTFEQGMVYVQKAEHPYVIEEVCGYSRDGRIKPKNDDTMDTVTYDLMMAEESVMADRMYESRDL